VPAVNGVWVIRRLVAWPLVCLGTWACWAGCDVAYYAHLARGQARIALNSHPLDEVMADPDLPADTREQLDFVQAVRAFAHDHIGLATSDNYTRYYDTGGEPVSWNVSACPPDRFVPHRWWFPIVGNVPYKGFFSRPRAIRERDRLRADGLDAQARAVSAYSTLGYFSDPVLTTMLAYPEDALADLLIHELTHATVYVKGQTDFNESLASFVWQVGSLEMLSHRYGADGEQVARARERRADAAVFRSFMAEAVSALDSLYSLGLPRDEVLQRRGEVFAECKGRYRRRRGQLRRPDQYDGFLEWEIDNARLMSYRRYNRDLDLFRRLYEREGNSLRRVVQVAATCEHATDPWQCVREIAERVAE